MSESTSAANTTRENELPIPPATFEFFVLSLKMQAEMALGLLHITEEDKDKAPDFRVARHTIDLLSMLSEKTKGNLTIDEQRLIENSLTELRFRFVQRMEESSK
ncbi:MAG TPA: DUF1844 domain-containing protein [Bryobacteraceae bacterium]|nr:DUF1844 domain-containing protein [Bryobacteraceae bacterium]